MLLTATAVLYLWGLSASEWANSYYAAAAQAGSQSWKALLFGSSDAANSVTIDKPPASLWVMGLSVRLFGLSSWSVLAPQALQGVAAVGLLYASVRRVSGSAAGLLAGAALAVTPAAALMFRFNNPDALLTLLLVAAAYATVRALEQASTAWIALAAAAVGFGFLTKMLQAFLVLPAVAGVYLYAAPTSPAQRVRQLGLAAGAGLVSAGWYVALVALWPEGARPSIGGSQTNSIIELTLGYNGFARLTGEEVGRIGGGPAFTDGAGLLRMVSGQAGGQIAWLLPAALLLVAVGLWLRRGRPRTDPRRASVLLWAGWLLVTAAVFSAMQGIFHAYYVIALAPAVAALVGIGAGECWARRHDRVLARASLAVVVLLTAGWSVVLLGREPGWLPWLQPAVGVAGGLAAALVAVDGRRARLVGAGTVTAAGAAMLLAPTAVSISTAATPHGGALPSTSPSFASSGPDGPGVRGGDGLGAGGPQAGGLPAWSLADAGPPDQLTGGGLLRRFLAGGSPGGVPGGGLGGLLAAGAPPEELVDAVQADAEEYTWPAAVIGSNQAAGVQLASQVPVMPVGGFNGTDPFPTLDQFRRYVAGGEIHYFLAAPTPGPGPGGFGPAHGGSRAARRISDWVAEHFASETIGGVTVYDLTERE